MSLLIHDHIQQQQHCYRKVCRALSYQMQWQQTTLWQRLCWIHCMLQLAEYVFVFLWWPVCVMWFITFYFRCDYQVNIAISTFTFFDWFDNGILVSVARIMLNKIHVLALDKEKLHFHPNLLGPYIFTPTFPVKFLFRQEEFKNTLCSEVVGMRTYS